MFIKDNSLTPVVLNIIRGKATEPPFTGKYGLSDTGGTYVCRACGTALFRAQTQFGSGCGWPSFDAAIANAVLETMDADQIRTEITCANCHAHLGHVFQGEGFTANNLRHCVNAASLDWVNDNQVLCTEEAILAGGCFWGVEYYLSKLKGVLKTEVGYIGGTTLYPSYEEVCQGSTGHVEAVRVLYDPSVLSYTALLQYFFEIHDPTQIERQGPDIGPQYQSVIFYYDEQQKDLAIQTIQQLEQAGYLVATKVLPVTVFWEAEPYHQAYYSKVAQVPYCHVYTKRFGQ